jgi:hypothetical protein
VIGGDRLRIYNICKILSHRYELTLLSLCESNSEMLLDVPEDTVFSKVIRVYQPKWKSYFNSFLSLFTGMPSNFSWNSIYLKLLMMVYYVIWLEQLNMLETQNYLLF